MARDFGMSVSVTRTNLGLAPLQLNDHVNYYIGAEFLGGEMTWERSQAKSAYLDGAVTTSRVRNQVSEPITVECLGTTLADMNAKIATVIAAFTQDTFNLAVAIGPNQFQYQCEAADYKVAWQTNRTVVRQGQVTFTCLRQPVALVGSY